MKHENLVLLERLRKIRTGLHHDRFHQPAVPLSPTKLSPRDVNYATKIMQRYGSLKLQQERKRARGKLMSDNSVRFGAEKPETSVR